MKKEKKDVHKGCNTRIQNLQEELKDEKYFVTQGQEKAKKIEQDLFYQIQDLEYKVKLKDARISALEMSLVLTEKHVVEQRNLITAKSREIERMNTSRYNSPDKVAIPSYEGKDGKK